MDWSALNPANWFKKSSPQSTPMPQAAVSAPASPPGQLESSPTDMGTGGRRRKHRKTKKAGRRHRKTKAHRKY